jgi:hypothetical protein
MMMMRRRRRRLMGMGWCSRREDKPPCQNLRRGQIGSQFVFSSPPYSSWVGEEKCFTSSSCN